jgi:hypothetical protein
MMEELRPSETLILTRSKQRNVPEDGMHHNITMMKNFGEDEIPRISTDNFSKCSTSNIFL